jgi:cardiolipin synthase
LVHLPPSYPAYLEGLSNNIRCAAFNPHHTYLTYISNGRDHRKILVIDGHTAFSGGMNLADEYINKKVKYGHWKDNGVMLKGEAVWSFTAMFLELWNASYAMTEQVDQFKPQTYSPKAFAEEGYIQPFGDTPFDKHAVGKNVYIEILKKAKRYVYIFTPYLIIDYEMKSALSSAVNRGVDVRIVTPGIPDKKIVFFITRSNYAVLLKAGVKIYEYTPGFLHSKSYLCDDEIAVVGTINMDYLSFYLEFECAVLMYKTSAIMDFKRDCMETFGKSRQIILAEL